MFDLLYQEIIEIGENIGLNIWETLTYEKQQEELLNNNETNYHIANILPNKTPVLIYQQQNSNSYVSSSYTINLNTLEPTKKSVNQTKIPQHIKDKYCFKKTDSKEYTDFKEYKSVYIPTNTKFACFDTETTGLSEDDVVIQFAIGFYDEDGNLLKSTSNIWKLLENTPISLSAYNVHKIGRERINKEGIDPKEQLILFQNICIELKKRNLKIIAHNSSFDYRLLKQTALKYNINFILQKEDFFCTMTHSKNILKLKNKNGRIKNPSNRELYKYFMNEEPTEKLHDALEDIKVTAKSYSVGLKQHFWY